MKAVFADDTDIMGDGFIKCVKQQYTELMKFDLDCYCDEMLWFTLSIAGAATPVVNDYC